MQTRRMIVALFASIAVFYLWMMISPRFFPPPTTQPAAPQPWADTPVPGTRTRPAPAGTRPPETVSQPVPAAGAPPQANVIWGENQVPVILGEAGKDSPFPMALQIDPRGASVARAEIRGHYETVEKEEPYSVLSPMTLPDNTGREQTFHSFSTPRIRFENLGIEAPLDEGDWQCDEQSDTKAVWSVRIETLAGLPLARVIKTYTLEPQTPEERTYDLGFSVGIENLSDDPLEVILTQRGPVGFQKEQPRREDRRVIAAFWREGEFDVKGGFRSDIIKKKIQDLAADNDQEKQRVAWAAAVNQYFTCIMTPAGRVGPDDPPRFASVEALCLMEQAKDHDEDLTFRYITTPTIVASGATREIRFECYIGPKSKQAFEQVEAYKAHDYYEVIKEGFYFCASDALVGLMMTLLNAFHKIPPNNYGLAIIVLVLVVRGLLHPITKKSQVNMLKMQKQQARLQPKIAQIREKYANDRTRMNQATMELYRQEGINPAGNVLACLPMMLQMPIWIALWTALASTIDMRHAPFDGWWIRDLAGPDALYTFSKPVTIPLIGFLMGGPIESFNLLPILLGISQLLQARFMPRSQAPKTNTSGAPDQMDQQRKMMMMMSVLFVFILYNAPSGLNLYIMSSNVFGMLEQWRIRQHLANIDEHKEEEERRKKAAKKAGKKSWLQKKWDKLAKEAEEARKPKSDRTKKKPKARR